MLDNGDNPVIRILVIDDHEIFLAGLRSLLEREPGLIVVGEARNGTEALEAAARTQPDIILLDLDLGTECATTLLPSLRKTAERARIVVLTGVPDSDLHLKAVCRGALGIVFKLQAPRLLLDAIRKVHAGEAWLNRTMVAAAMTRLQPHQPKKPDPHVVKIARLTARELEVIALVGEARRNKGIAQQLFISEKTVRHYLTSIFSKLEVSDRLCLMMYAYQHGLAKLPSTKSSQGSPIVAFKE